MSNPRSLVIITTLLFGSIFSNAQTKNKDIDAKWVINKSIEALGGETFIRSINTLYTEMSTEMEGRPVTWITKEMLPNNGAFQISYKGDVVYEDWFNGKLGYELVNGERKETDPEILADKFPRKNIFNELDYLDPSIYKLELMKDQKVNGTDCYKVKAIFVDKFERHLYFDKTNFRIIKEERVKKGDKQVLSTAYFSDFKKFGDLEFYTVFTMGEGPDAQKAVVTKVLVNEGISKEDFNK